MVHIQTTKSLVWTRISEQQQQIDSCKTNKCNSTQEKKSNTFSKLINFTYY